MNIVVMILDSMHIHNFPLPDCNFGKNIIIFGVDNSYSVHVDNKKRNIIVLDEGLTQGLDNIAITAEDKYPINFTESGKRFLLSLHYNGSISFLFVFVTNVYQFKAKYSEIKPYALSLGKILKYFTLDNTKKTGLKGSGKVFSVGYNAIDNSHILDNHR